MGDSQTPQPPAVSPLVAALSTPSTAMYKTNGGNFNGASYMDLSGHRPLALPIVHPEGPQFNTPPSGNGGPVRVGPPIPVRPAPYPPGSRVNHPSASFNNPHGAQVMMPRLAPNSHPQMVAQPMSINHGPPPQIMHLPQTSGGIIDKIRLDDLVKQIDPNTNLEDNVKEALIEYCDDFISDVIAKVCNLATYRTNQLQTPTKKIEVRDVEMVLNMAYNMPAVPRAAVHVFGHQATQYPKLDGHPPTDAHKQRIMLIRKQLKKI